MRSASTVTVRLQVSGQSNVQTASRSTIVIICSVRNDSHLRAVELGRWGRSPHAGLARGPPLGPLRRVMMPGPRLEITELFVLHLIELAEELDHLLVRIAVVGRNVMAG